MTRTQRLREALGMNGHQAALITNPSNLFYFTGYTGEGFAFLAEGEGVIVTDFRYTEQAEKQSPGFAVRMTDKGLSAEAAADALCVEHGVDTLYYEDDAMTVRELERFRKAVKSVEWKPAMNAAERLREVKDEDELSRIERACKLTGEAFERLLPEIRVGVSEKELALKLNFDMLTHGAEKLAFDTIVAAGAHGSLPHAVPGEYRVQKGDMVTFDFGAKVDGYCADMTRTVAVGEPSGEMRRVYQVVLDAQQMAQDAVMAGKDCRAIDALARDYIYAQGYEGRFGHGLGHSLGIDIHESPRFSVMATGALKPNHVMTVEPGVYLPGVGGVRIENTVIVTDTGCRALTLPAKELLIL